MVCNGHLKGIILGRACRTVDATGSDLSGRVGLLLPVDAAGQAEDGHAQTARALMFAGSWALWREAAEEINRLRRRISMYLNPPFYVPDTVLSENL
jgi:hypothetical protein